jgi:hypothetical protein
VSAAVQIATRDVRFYDREIRQLAFDEIATRQARVRELGVAIEAAEGRAGRASYVVQMARFTGAPPPPSELERMEREVDQARKVLTGLRDERSRVEAEIRRHHSALTDAHKHRAIRVALGKPLILEPLLDWRQDAALVALTTKAADIATQKRAVEQRQADARARVESADALVRELRRDVLLERATKKDLQSAERDAKVAGDALAAIVADVDAVTAAARQIAEERSARESELRAQVLPQLRAEYATRMATLIAAVRAAAEANEQLQVVFEALSTVAAVPVQPWSELRALIAESKFRRWMKEAAAAGLTD